MEEEDKNANLEADIAELRQQLQEAQRESYARKTELKRDRAFLGDELQRVRDKVAATSEEKEAYEAKLEQMRRQIKELQDAAVRRNVQAAAAARPAKSDAESNQAELEALQSQLDAIRKVWVVQDEQWSPGTLVEITSKDSAVVETKDGQTAEHALADLVGVQLTSDQNCCSNLADLGQDSLKQPVIVETLLQNQSKQSPYTFVGSVLLYLHNPEVLPSSSHQIRTAYRCCNHTGELQPHVFSVLETAYRSMRLERQSQSVVLTGSTGSGKSSLFRSSLEYLVLDRHVGNAHKVLDGLTVLEAFGTAQTASNKRSSRMSIVVEVQYDIAGTALGASTAVYGLEKVRLTEKRGFNFAVFYQMCCGATEGEKKTLHLKSAAEFPYLNPGGNAEETRRITNSDAHNYDSTGDVESYRQLKNAMSNIGLDSVMRAAIFRVLAAILWLGKIEFIPATAKQRQPVVWDRTVLDKAAHLLRCTSSELEEALLNNTESGTDSATMNEQAIYARDVLAQSLYTRVFNWIVEQINGLLSKDDAFSVVSVLDLVSFEADDQDSSFDHFCRNYATECVENLFNRDFFELEKQEYHSEHLHLPEQFEFPSNNKCVDLIDRQDGFISLLDQECQFAKGSEVALIRRLNAAFERDEYYTRSRSKQGFNIKHWQDEVHYTTKSLIERNQDFVPSCVLNLMDQCRCRFLAQLFPSSEGVAEARPVNLLTQLKNQIAALLRPLSSPEPGGNTAYFVRCLCPVKPGSADDAPDSGYLLKQLRAFRVPQMLQLRHLGFPVRSSFVDFYHRYRIFAQSQLVDRADSMYKQQCEYILASMDFDRGSYQTGTSKVYLKEPQLKLLETRRQDVRERAALRLQKQFRSCRFLARFREWRRHTALVAPILRGLLARQTYKQQCEALRMAEEEEESNKYNEYVRSQLLLAQGELDRMREAFKESEKWNIEWRRQRIENAQQVAEAMFVKASQQMAAMDALLIRDFRAPDDIGQSVIMISHEDVAKAVDEVVQTGNAEAVAEYKRQVQEKEDEKATKLALMKEEQHMRDVKEALSRRKQAHPLQELAWMRAEEQMQRIAAIVQSTKLFDRNLQAEQDEMDQAYERGYDDFEQSRRRLEQEKMGDEPLGDAEVEPASLPDAIALLPEGLMSAEVRRINDGKDVHFEPEPPRQVPVAFHVIEVPDETEEEEEVLIADPEEWLEANKKKKREQLEEEITPEQDIGGPPPPPPPDFVPPLETANLPEASDVGPAESLTVEKIIEKRRAKRREANDPNVDIDTIFAEIDNQLANIKHQYFDTAESGDKYEFVGKEEEPELDYKYRFKYKFRGVDAGLTDQDLQSLV